jgi:hypothetical protein
MRRQARVRRRIGLAQQRRSPDRRALVIHILDPLMM